jgi:hypothetical protein
MLRRAKGLVMTGFFRRGSALTSELVLGCAPSGGQ